MVQFCAIFVGNILPKRFPSLLVILICIIEIAFFFRIELYFFILMLYMPFSQSVQRFRIFVVRLRFATFKFFNVDGIAKVEFVFTRFQYSNSLAEILYYLYCFIWYVCFLTKLAIHISARAHTHTYIDFCLGYSVTTVCFIHLFIYLFIYSFNFLWAVQ